MSGDKHQRGAGTCCDGGARARALSSANLQALAARPPRARYLCSRRRWFGNPKSYRFDLKLDVGETGINYAEVAKREHLTELEVEVRRQRSRARRALRLVPSRCVCNSDSPRSAARSAPRVQMRRLNDKMKDIMKEQEYQRVRELAFRATSESTNDRVKWWSIMQTVIVLGAGLWNIWHIKRHLKEKKQA